MKAHVSIVGAVLLVTQALCLQACKVKVKNMGDGGLDASTTSQSSEPARSEASTPPKATDAGKGQAGTKAAGGSGGSEPRAQSAGAGGSAGKSGAGAVGGGGGQGGAPSNKTCSVERPAATNVASTIWMVVDGSGSMVEMLGEKSRWAALREALLDNSSGVIRSVPQARWGLALYDGPLPGGTTGVILPDGGTFMPALPPATTCPRLVSVDPKNDNFAAINAAYPLDPLGGSTPTDTAIAAVATKIMAASKSESMPTIIVLATDGQPNDFCSTAAVPPDTRPNVIMAVQKLAAAGVKTYVISLAGADQQLTDHLNQVAQAGNSGKPLFVPSNKSQLIESLRQIVASEPSCDVTLSKAIEPLRACDGLVQIDGEELVCNGADGFGLRDPNTLRLSGTACTAYKADPQALHVSYPCDALR